MSETTEIRPGRSVRSAGTIGREDLRRFAVELLDLLDGEWSAEEGR